MDPLEVLGHEGLLEQFAADGAGYGRHVEVGQVSFEISLAGVGLATLRAGQAQVRVTLSNRILKIATVYDTKCPFSLFFVKIQILHDIALCISLLQEILQIDSILFRYSRLVNFLKWTSK